MANVAFGANIKWYLFVPGQGLAMRSLHDEGCCERLVRRLTTLRVDAQPDWGDLTASKMVGHVTETVCLALGEVTVQPIWVPQRYWPFKQLVVYVLPFPEGADVGRSARIVRQERLDRECLIFEAALGRFTARRWAASWPDHPYLGGLSRRAWGVLCYRHIDHHFRQFHI